MADRPRQGKTEQPASKAAAPGRPDDTLPALQLEVMRAAMAPWKWLTAPAFFGLERVPRDRPALFVGNHTLMGMLDVPLMILELLDECDLLVHPLGDHFHFQIPAWRELVTSFGVVDGSPESCGELMRAGKSILVFPGGGREVFKRKGEKYQLLWEERAGFARLAAEHRYAMVPFASVGAEDCFDILMDGNDLMRTPLGPVVERLHPRPDLIPPLVRGIGPSVFPRPERFYFHFGDPVDTGHLDGGTDDEEAIFALREQVRRSVEAGIELLLAKRENDPDRSFLSRLRKLPRPFRTTGA